MSVSDDTLMAYVDGELDDAARAEVTRALAADPVLARRVAAQQALRARLRRGFDTVLTESVPPRLIATARGGQDARANNVVAFPGRAPRAPWLQWGSLAASFALGALVWHFAGPGSSSGPVTAANGQIIASGALAQALSGQLAAQQDPAAPVQIGVSFRSHQGTYCRTFQLRRSASAAGLACHESQGWAVQILAHTESGAATGPYRQAGSALPPAILQAVDQTMVGEALDATGEAQARAAGWNKP